MGLVAFNSTGTLIAAALLLGIVNAFVRPIIIIPLTLPITLLTLGLFLVVINALHDHARRLACPGLPGRRLLVCGLRRDCRETSQAGSCPGWIGRRGRVEVMTVSRLRAGAGAGESGSLLGGGRGARRLVRLIWVLLARGRFAAKTPAHDYWILLDFLGKFSRPNGDLSMGYAA